MWYIYSITNKINGKVYVGQRKTDKDPSEDPYFGSGTCLKSAIEKGKKSHFKKEILKEGIGCRTAANIFEMSYIQKLDSLYPNGYNLTAGGDSGFYTEESKKKMSKKAIERWQSLSYREKMSNRPSPKGIKHTDKARKNMSESQKGHTLSEESRIKISDKLSGRKLSESTKNKMKGRIPWNKGLKYKTNKNIKNE